MWQSRKNAIQNLSFAEFGQRLTTHVFHASLKEMTRHTRFTLNVVVRTTLLTAVFVSLAGCAAIVPLEPAPDANNPGCAEVIVRLPERVAEQPQRETNAQATGAWGSPASILLHCGVSVPGR